MQALTYLRQGLEQSAADGSWSLQASACSAKLLLPMLLSGMNSSQEDVRGAALSCMLALPKVRTSRSMALGAAEHASLAQPRHALWLTGLQCEQRSPAII